MMTDVKIGKWAVVLLLLLSNSYHLIQASATSFSHDCGRNVSILEDNFIKLTITYCIYLVQHDNYETAQAQLQRLENYEEPTAEVVRGVYNGDLKNINRTLNFLALDISCPAYISGLYALFQEMIKNGQKEVPEMLMVANLKTKCDNNDAAVVRFKEELKQHTMTVVEAFAKKLENDYEIKANIYNFSKQSARAEQCMWKYLPEIIRAFEIYNSRNNYNYHYNYNNYNRELAQNFSIPLKLVDNFPSLPVAVVGYKTLLNSLKSQGKSHSNEALYLAFSVKKFHKEHARSIESDSALRLEYNQLRNEFPSPIKNVIWNGNTCRIKNVLYNNSGELFTSANQFTHGNGNNEKSNVILVLSTEERSNYDEQEVSGIPEGEWKIEHLLGAIDSYNPIEKLYCRIMNNYWSETGFLCILGQLSTRRDYDSHCSIVSNCLPDQNNNNYYQWKLLPRVTEDGNEVFKIFNQRGSDYPYLSLALNLDTTGYYLFDNIKFTKNVCSKHYDDIHNSKNKDAATDWYIECN